MTRECGALIGVARQGRGWKKELWGRGSFVEFWGPWPCHQVAVLKHYVLFDVLVVTDPIIWIGVVCILFPLYHSISCSEDHLASHSPSCITLKTSQMSQCESILHGKAVKSVDHTQRGGRISTRRWFRRYWLRFRPVRTVMARTGEGGAAALDRRGATRCPGTLAELDALHIPMEGSLKPSSCRPHPR